MSIELDLAICVTSSVLPRVEDAAEVIRDGVVAPFRKGSNEDIQLTPRILRAATDAPEQVGSDFLHDALEKATGFQRGSNKVSHIGIILAGSYDPRTDIFGYMFDEAFRPDSSTRGSKTPREGCAVFLSAIDARRSAGDFLPEVLYTAIHELGHVFNLQHSSAPSYMATSADLPHPFPPLPLRGFNEVEVNMLSHCSTSPNVWPGGSAFSDTGPFASANSPLGKARSKSLDIKLAIDRESCWPFEPVELDVTLAARGDTAVVPDMIDPGYDAFMIWIEEPDGCRRRYVSPRHYCPRKKKLKISPGTPFRRDISIFGEPGRFCFRKVGTHRIFATFAPGGPVVRSNIVELEVKAPESSDYYTAAAKVFTDRDLGQLLYYRHLTPRRLRKLSRLAHLCEQYPKAPATAMSLYAMGRAMARQGGAGKELALAFLKRAAKHRKLGGHGRGIAEGVMDRL